MLSICTTCKNRSVIKLKNGILEPLPFFLKAVNKITEDVELIISDWGSTDVPIQETVEKYITQIPYKIINMGDKRYSMTQGRNASYENSEGEHILFIDADIAVKNKSIKSGIRKLRDGNLLFPIVFAFTESGTKKGLWCADDFKTMMIKKDVFERVGPWKENSMKNNMLRKACRGCVHTKKTIREKDRGFIHHWHPSTKKNIWTRRK